ncbi:hypothetical protein [Mycoplasma sp. ATU-Cv-703]|uniref:hypothetical protein n=1 Tax=Mycoplasma sp. ATU-Cv-703 TaxID=2498595 RepID=UPI000FDE9D40
MTTSHKLWTWLKQNLRTSTYELALAAVFVALWVFSYKFISVNLRFMRFGIVYAWVITIGLIFRPLLAVKIALIADHLCLLVGGGLGRWMLEYALIYPTMVLLVGFLKRCLNTQHQRWWLAGVVFSVMSTLISVLITMALYRGFVSQSKNGDQAFLFNSLGVYVLMWSVCAFLAFAFGLMLLKYLKSRHQRLQEAISVVVVVTLVVVIYVWLWGPIAQIRYLVQRVGYSPHELFAKYDFYLVPRILKTPIIVPLYSLIVYALQRVFPHVNRAYRW